MITTHSAAYDDITVCETLPLNLTHHSIVIYIIPYHSTICCIIRTIFNHPNRPRGTRLISVYRLDFIILDKLTSLIECARWGMAGCSNDV